MGAALRAAVVKAGLFEREAAAMVASWRTYWFDEEGTRVLYIMPRAEVNRVLSPNSSARIVVAAPLTHEWPDG